jgi:phage protein D
VRRPDFEVAFGSADDWLPVVLSITVEAGLAPFVDVATVVAAFREDGPEIALGDEGSISLGYRDGSVDTVFSGKVDSVRHTINGTLRFTAVNGGAAFSAARINQSYEEQSAADIVNDLASQAGASTGTVDAGVDFPFYVVDDGRSLYQHIERLAKLSNLAAYFNPDGELEVSALEEAQPVATFTYGIDIVALEVIDSTPAVGAVKAVGDGAAGSEGAEAWSWFVKDAASVTGEAGDGDPARLVSEASLRSQEAASTAAEGALGVSSRANVTGRILVPGTPAAVVGSTIAIADAPHDSLNGNCIVTRVRHEYSKRGGFVSVLEFTKASEGGLGGLL